MHSFCIFRPRWIYRGQLLVQVRNIWVFFSSRSLKMREKYISFAQFAYFLREVCIDTFQCLNDRIHNYLKKKHNCKFYHSKIEKKTHFPQKIFKLSKTNWAKLIHFSLVLREREEKTQIFRTLDLYLLWAEQFKD